MHFGRLLFVFVIVSLLIGCSPTRCGFAIDTSYQAPFFDSRVLTGRSLVVVPLLKDAKVDSSGLLSDVSYLQSLRKLREDLNCVSFNKSADKIRTRFGDPLFNTFIVNLFKGDIPVLQTSDSVWNIISEEYMSVIRVKSAHSVRMFSGDVRKRILLEGELWDCRKAEVVFRLSVNGLCLTEDVKDDRFIMDGILTFYRELPAAIPAYDTQSW
jgi:hypothetical protein